MKKTYAVTLNESARDIVCRALSSSVTQVAEYYGDRSPELGEAIAVRDKFYATRGIAVAELRRGLDKAEKRRDDPEAAHGLADDTLETFLRDVGLGEEADRYARIPKWFA